MGKSWLTENYQDFGHDSLLHVRGKTLKMGIFGHEKELEKPCIPSVFVCMYASTQCWLALHGYHDTLINPLSAGVAYIRVFIFY